MHHGILVAVDGTSALAQGGDDRSRRHGALLRVFGVRGRVPHDSFHEALQNAADLFVEEARNALDASAASQTADRALRHAADVVLEHLLHALRVEALGCWTVCRVRRPTPG